MSRIVRVKNTTVDNITLGGKALLPDVYVDITNSASDWAKDDEIFEAVSDGTIIVNNGADDISTATSGWNWLIGNTMPISSTIDGTKIAVHSSSKPEPEGITTYAVWAGSGDDIDEPDETLSLNGGELLTFNMSYQAGGPHDVSKDVKFDPRHGRVWIHEAYLKFEGGGVPDYLDVDTIAPPSQLQQVANLDLVVNEETSCVTFAPGGPGTGTHGFAATPFLITRPYAQDGGWNYEGGQLTPNMTNTGKYRISTQEKVVHRFFSKLPMHGSSSTYFTMTSDETSELFAGYFIRITAHNESNSDWTASCIMEIFRQRTSNM